MSALNEVKQRAREANVLSILTEETEDFHAFIPWDEKNPQLALVPQRHVVENRVVDQTEVQPNAGFDSATFLNSRTIDFKLDTNDVSVIDHALLAFSITNSTGAAVVLPPTSFWFDKIEIMNGESNVLTTIQDLDNWLALCMLPRNDFEQIAALCGTTDAYSTAGVTIASTASTELYLPLFTLFSAARLHLPGLRGPLTFRFRTKASDKLLISGTHPTFTKVVMLLSGFDESQEKRNARTAAYRSLVPRFRDTPIFLPYYGWEHYSTSQSLIASTRTEIKLSGFSGKFAAVFVIIRAAITAANQGTFIAVETLALQDQNGSIFCGNHLKTHARSRIIAAAQMQNLSARNVNYYMIPFSSAVPTDFSTGQVHGYQMFTGNETLVITPTASLGSATYQIDVIALRGNALRIHQGGVQNRR